jgi:hypothetical protein
MRGSKAAEGATRTAPNGYHYTKVDSKWKLTHHITMEKILGRPIDLSVERVVFKEGYSSKDYADPDAVEVRVKGVVSNTKQIARLIARRDEIQAQIDFLEAEKP